MQRKNGIQLYNTIQLNTQPITKANLTKHNEGNLDYNMKYGISPIFHDDYVEKVEEVKNRTLFAESVKAIQEKTIERIQHRKKELGYGVDRSYNPNYDSVCPKAPVYSFATSAKLKEMKDTFYQHMCSKFDRHNEIFHNNKLDKKFKGISLRNNYLNKRNKHSSNNNYISQTTEIQKLQKSEDFSTSNHHKKNNKSEGIFNTVNTTNSKRRSKLKLKPLNESRNKQLI